MICPLDFCERSSRSGREPLCEAHYYQRRRGKPFTPLQRRNHTECWVVGCENVPRGRFCTMHEARFQRHGDPECVVAPKDRMIRRGECSATWNEQGSYAATHQRLRRALGSASSSVCACGADARQWAYIGPRATGERQPWTPDLSQYRAMCVPCHKVMDLERLS
jgi:hypothetical protein